MLQMATSRPLSAEPVHSTRTASCSLSRTRLAITCTLPLQAVRRSHRRLGLARKLMDQVAGTWGECLCVAHMTRHPTPFWRHVEQWWKTLVPGMCVCMCGSATAQPSTCTRTCFSSSEHHTRTHTHTHMYTTIHPCPGQWRWSQSTTQMGKMHLL